LVVYLAVLLSLLQGVSMRGAKMLVSLSALDLGATPFQVGLLAALFAAFPLLLAVYAGKASDRIGVKRPILGGAVIMAAGILVPLAVKGIAGLMACSALIGLGHIFFHVSIHNLIGAYGEGEARTRNFATFSLGASIAAFIGPSLAGFSIDGWGFRPTHVLLAAVSLAPALILAAYPKLVPPRAIHGKDEAGGGSMELLRDPGLRRTLVMSGVTLTGIELFTFYFPVYGRSIGLSASAIGMVMSSYAIAAFIVRMGMHRAARRVGEVGVLTASLFIAGATYMLVPLVTQAPLLALVAFLLGIGLGCAQPLTILLTYNHAPPGRSGEALGMRLFVNKFTQILVPLVFGAMGSAFGLLPVFWANGAFLLAGGFVSLAERRVSASREVKDGAAELAEQREEDA
jgi:MFS family permease